MFRAALLLALITGPALAQDVDQQKWNQLVAQLADPMRRDFACDAWRGSRAGLRAVGSGRIYA